MFHNQARAIETNRLILRLFKPADAQALYSIYRDPLTMRYISTGTRSYEQVHQQITEIIRGWEQAPWGTWAVIWKANAALIGTAGFVHAGEIGYIFDRAFWGRGITTEALHACLRYGFEHLQLETIGAGALRANLASLRVIEKAGLHPVPNEFFDIHGGTYYQIDRAAFHPGDALFIMHPANEPIISTHQNNP